MRHRNTLQVPLSDGTVLSKELSEVRTSITDHGNRFTLKMWQHVTTAKISDKKEVIEWPKIK